MAFRTCNEVGIIVLFVSGTWMIFAYYLWALGEQFSLLFLACKSHLKGHTVAHVKHRELNKGRLFVYTDDYDDGGVCSLRGNRVRGLI